MNSPRPRMTDAERQDVVSRYVNGTTVDDICAHFQREESTIREILRRAGAMQGQPAKRVSRKSIVGAS